MAIYSDFPLNMLIFHGYVRKIGRVDVSLREGSHLTSSRIISHHLAVNHPKHHICKTESPKRSMASFNITLVAWGCFALPQATRSAQWASSCCSSSLENLIVQDPRKTPLGEKQFHFPLHRTILVGGLTPLKNMRVSCDDYSQVYGKTKTVPNHRPE